MSGTSIAAPHVTGAASVLMELNPEMSADYIRALLDYSANLYGSPDEYGNGIVDLEYAVEINDKFKKLYEKHIAKEEKNEKKKEKQKEKFWGEVLKTIPQNEKAVETFTELDVVEGMWKEEIHTYVVDAGVKDLQLSFTYEQMQVLLYAAAYPDKEDSFLEDMDDNPYHGFLWQRQYKIRIVNNKKEKYDYKPLYNSNYIANYIFLTKVARAYGNAASISRGNMFQNDYDRILEDITTTRLGAKTWEQVFSSLNTERGVNLSATPENKKLFIYGIAMHCISDTFAHSTWKDEGDKLTKIIHDKDWNKNADNSTYVSMRYLTAKEAVRSVLIKAYNGTEGTLYDFVFPAATFSGYYLGNFAPYAQKAAPDLYSSLKSYIERGDLAYNASNYDFGGYTYYIP